MAIERPIISDSHAMFCELDQKLEDHELPLNIVVCGGIVLQMVYELGRATHDIDSLTAIDEYAKDLIAEVGQSYFGSMEGANKWLNDDVVSFYFDRILPEEWDKRAQEQPPLFNGHYLKVFPLAKRDLILTKLYAIFTRGTAEIDKDIGDLKQIGVTSHDLLDVLPDLESMLKGTHWKKTKEELCAILAVNWDLPDVY